MAEDLLEEEKDEAGDGDGENHAPESECVPTTSPTTTTEGGPSTSWTTTVRQEDRAREAEVEGEVVSRHEAPRRIQEVHPLSKTIGGIDERTTRSRSRNSSHFAHAAFVASFEPKDIGHALSDTNWVNSMHEELEHFERNQVWELVEPPPRCEAYVDTHGEYGYFGCGEPVDQQEYQSMIGSLLYLTVTRPDIQFSVCLCARFQASPRTSHRQAVKRIFRYLQSAPGLVLWYSSCSTLSLHGFSDADFAGCRVERKSTSGSCQFLGSSLVSWSSRKQSSVAQSTTESEYVAAASCCSQLLWISYTLRDFGEECTQIPLLCDSTSAIREAKNPVLHSRTKHIAVRYHFSRDNVEKGTTVLIHVPTQDQLADIFTKPLDQATFMRLRGGTWGLLPFLVDSWGICVCTICIIPCLL
jgi:hypothetical protein